MLFTAGKELSLLAIGAHPDDIELGAGGFIHRLRSELDARVRFLILTHGLKRGHDSHDFNPGQRRQECIKASSTLGIAEGDVTVLGYDDCGLHRDLHSLIEEIEGLLVSEKFDVILTHAQGDTHNDHKRAHEATVSAARAFDGTVLLYQAPSTIPNEFRPTFFVDLKCGDFDAKQRALEEHVSQRQKPFMSAERLLWAARSWGAFLNTPTRLLEAFELYKSFWR